MLPEHEIGKNIRMIRKLKELTLEDLAGKTGFTKGYLSKVENSEKAPPVSTLLNIARAMDVGMSSLFGEGHEPTSLSLVKRNERQEMARNGTTFGYSYETLAHKYPDKKMEPYILTIPPEIEKSPLFQHQGEEMIFVLQGTLRFLHGENEVLLEEGDCIYFDSGIGHRGFALGGREVKILIVMLSF
jgi:transcriptional regulator with XRE-family HTH domain